MNISEKIQEIADNIPKVYEAGKDARDSEFWDTFQQNGERRLYNFAFINNGKCWTRDTFKPKYDIIMTSGAANAFYLWQGLPQTVDIGAVLAERGLTLDTSGATNLQNFMAYGTSIVGYLPCIDLSSAGGYTTTMFRSAAIDGIERLVVTKYNNFTDMFTGCTKLKRVIFSGVIASGTLNLSTSPLLDADSLESENDDVQNGRKSRTVPHLPLARGH